MVTGLQEICYEARLKELGLTTLETRRLRADLLEVFKIMQGSERIDSDSVVKRSIRCLVVSPISFRQTAFRQG